MREVVGAAPYGGDLNRFPSRIVDALVILHNESLRVDNLQMSRGNPKQGHRQSKK